MSSKVFTINYFGSSKIIGQDHVMGYYYQL